MALLASRLGEAIAAKVLAATGGGTPSQADIDATKAIWTDIASEIINEFKNFALVNPGTLAAAPGIPTAGTPVAQVTTAPGPLQGTGTIS